MLLRKVLPAGRAEEVAVDYIGFDIPDEFVVGYGLDFDGFYRNYPQIAVLRAGAAGSFRARAKPAAANLGMVPDTSP